MNMLRPNLPNPSSKVTYCQATKNGTEPLVDPGGAKDTPCPISFIFMQFSAISYQIIRFCLKPCGWLPPAPHHLGSPGSATENRFIVSMQGDTWLSLRRAMLAEAREIRVEQLVKERRKRTRSVHAPCAENIN